jgi:hypothetical protein
MHNAVHWHSSSCRLSARSYASRRRAGQACSAPAADSAAGVVHRISYMTRTGIGQVDRFPGAPGLRPEKAHSTAPTLKGAAASAAVRRGHGHRRTHAARLRSPPHPCRTGYGHRRTHAARIVSWSTVSGSWRGGRAVLARWPGARRGLPAGARRPKSFDKNRKRVSSGPRSRRDHLRGRRDRHRRGASGSAARYGVARSPAGRAVLRSDGPEFGCAPRRGPP